MATGQTPKLPPVPPLTSAGFADPVWARWLNALRVQVIATVSALSIQSSNGFAGTVTLDAQQNTIVTLSTPVVGMLKGFNGAITAATSSDFMSPGNNLSELVSVPTARTNLGLKSMSLQAANAVAVTGGTIAGVTLGTAQINGAVIDNASALNSNMLLASFQTLTDATGSAAGTLTNAPTAGNPTKWITINDNGITRRIPTW